MARMTCAACNAVLAETTTRSLAAFVLESRCHRCAHLGTPHAVGIA